jgi:sugar lactone lactonase YvrE
VRTGIAIIATFVVPSLWGAPIGTNQAADFVIGQPGFTTIPQLATPSAANLSNPRGVAVDPTTGKIFVADTNNNRVLRFASADSLSNGAAAEIALGQSDFVSKGFGTTATTMNSPCGVAVDGYGTLWVADTNNQRVLRFDNASSKTTGAAADGVLGQPDFVTNTVSFPPTQSSLTGPFCIAANKFGTIWIADPNVNRVLRFDYASAKADGADADAVLGQPDFVSYNPPATPTKASMDSPDGVTVDADDNLWVVDSNNNRVLRFDHASIKPIAGASADAVLGQPLFTTNAAGVTQYGFSSPSGCAIDSNGTLWVSNFYNRRVLGFRNALTKANGALADVVLGQTAFDIVVSYLPPTASSISSPQQIAADSDGGIWVANLGDNRILRFHPKTAAIATPTPSPAPPTLALSGKAAQHTAQPKAVVKGSAAGSAGIARVEYRGAKGGYRSARGTSSWSFRATLHPGVNVFFVRAVDALGQTSAPQKVILVRK